MGYIFEAMQGAGDGEQRKRPASSEEARDVSASSIPPADKNGRDTSDDTGVSNADAVEAQAASPDAMSSIPDAAPHQMDADPIAYPLESGRPSTSGTTNDDGHFDGEEPGAFDYEGMDDRLVALLEPASIMAEEYRSIRTGVLARWDHQRHLVHTITSATPQEGKTITSLNLGLSFAELRNRRTLVIEADLRLPQFEKLLALEEGPGMVELLRDEVSPEEVIQTVADSGLHVIPAGSRANNQAVQMLASNHATSLLERFRQQYDHVIVDTPPVVELADAGILGAQSDDVFLIARLNRTPRTLIEQAIRTLASYNAPVAGIIATDQQRSMRRYYHRYGYRYRYRYYYNKAA